MAFAVSISAPAARLVGGQSVTTPRHAAKPVTSAGKFPGSHVTFSSKAQTLEGAPLVSRASAKVHTVCGMPEMMVETSRKFGTALLMGAIGVLAVPSVAMSADLALGSQVFSNNCAACHSGGQNSVVRERTLARADLEKYLDGGYSEAAIVKQVTYGKNSMPAWEDTLDEDEIAAVAAYVYKTSGAGGPWSG